jgi:hypothetical protein
MLTSDLILTNNLISEAEWVAYLEENLTPSRATETASAVQVEGERLGLVSPIAKISPIARPPFASKPLAEVATPVMSASSVLKDRFREDILDRSVINAVSATNLSRSQLAIKAKPEWRISAQQVYRQVPPVPIPILSNPLTVDNFFLWPDPEEDSVEVNLPDKFAVQLGHQMVKPLPHSVVIDDRSKIADQLNPTKPAIRQGLVPTPQNNTSALNQAVLVDKPLVDRGILWSAMEIKRVRLKVRRAFFATIMPELQSFKLTIQPGVGGRKTMGTALFTVSLYAQADDAMLEKHRLEWTDALAESGYGARLWKFLPVNLQKLQAFLDLDPQQLRAPIQVAINASAGTATFIVELSNLGAQIWQQALETSQTQQISGIIRFAANFYARTDDRLRIHEQPFSLNLATLLSSCGPDHIEMIHPNVSLTTKLIVQSHAFVDAVSVTWQPKQGGETIHQRFLGNDGGVLTGVVLTDNLNTVDIAWDAQIQYRFPGWSIGSQQGNLSLLNATEIVKPGSSEWIKEYTIYTVLMASPTQVAQNPAEFEDIEVIATIIYSASYLTLPLATTFQPKHLEMTEVPFPIMPGQEPSQVGLTIVTKSKSQNTILNSVSRILQPEELLSNLKIFSDGKIEIRTSIDPISESSIDGDLFELLEKFKHS